MVKPSVVHVHHRIILSNKKNELLIYATIQMNPHGSRLRNQNITYFMIPFL